MTWLCNNHRSEQIWHIVTVVVGKLCRSKSVLVSTTKMKLLLGFVLAVLALSAATARTIRNDWRESEQETVAEGSRHPSDTDLQPRSLEWTLGGIGSTKANNKHKRAAETTQDLRSPAEGEERQKPLVEEKKEVMKPLADEKKLAAAPDVMGASKSPVAEAKESEKPSLTEEKEEIKPPVAKPSAKPTKRVETLSGPTKWKLESLQETKGKELPKVQIGFTNNVSASLRDALSEMTAAKLHVNQIMETLEHQAGLTNKIVAASNEMLSELTNFGLRQREKTLSGPNRGKLNSLQESKGQELQKPQTGFTNKASEAMHVMLSELTNAELRRRFGTLKAAEEAKLNSLPNAQTGSTNKAAAAIHELLSELTNAELKQREETLAELNMRLLLSALAELGSSSKLGAKRSTKGQLESSVAQNEKNTTPESPVGSVMILNRPGGEGHVSKGSPLMKALKMSGCAADFLRSQPTDDWILRVSKEYPSIILCLQAFLDD